MKYEGISKYKLNKIAIESFRNALRLHFDAILLFDNQSFPSAYQLAILSLEEFSKTKWIDHYIWTSEINDGYSNAEEEHEWLKLLYLHPRKQWNFVAREWQYYSPSFLDFVQHGKLEHKKQTSIYVGLARIKGKVDTLSRVSIPSQIKKNDAKQMISLVNSEFLEICKRIEEYEYYFEGAKGIDNILDYKIFSKLINWPHKSGLKNSAWLKKPKNFSDSI